MVEVFMAKASQGMGETGEGGGDTPGCSRALLPSLGVIFTFLLLHNTVLLF